VLAAVSTLMLAACRTVPEELALLPQEAGSTLPSEAVPPSWEFATAAYATFVPDDYEDLDTGSLWVGNNFSGGEELQWAITPMLGGVFGNTAGIAPGYKGSLGWDMLELYSEGEYLIDTGDTSDSFFYNWSELTLAPVDWLRFGLVTQRTRAYDADRDIQRGLLVGISADRFALVAYVLNPDDSEPIVIVSAGVDF
jgi:hypothetical protein